MINLAVKTRTASSIEMRQCMPLAHVINASCLPGVLWQIHLLVTLFYVYLINKIVRYMLILRYINIHCRSISLSLTWLKWIRHHFRKTRLTRHDRNTAYQLYPAILHVKTTLWYPQFVMLENTSVHWTTSKSRVDTIQLLSGNNTSSVTAYHHQLVTTVYELYSSFIYQWKWLSLC